MPKHKNPSEPVPSIQYQFGPYTLDLPRMVLLRKGVQVPLTPKVYETLVLLVRNRSRVLPKEELMRSIWPDSYVEEANLNQNISVLRRALGNGNGDGRFIETLPKKGYRFVAPVQEISEERSQIEKADQRFGVSLRVLICSTGGILLISLSAAVTWLLSERAHPSISTDHRIRPFAVDLPAQMYPAWSPDGTRIALVGEQGGNRRLWVKGVQDTNAIPVTPENLQLAQRQFPFWSPDSRVIYFFGSAASSSAYELYRVLSSGGEPDRSPTISIRRASRLFSNGCGPGFFTRRALDCLSWRAERI